MRILYVSGGSGGHLAPLVAVERAVHAADPSAESLFVCSKTEDDIVFLRKQNVKYSALPLPRHPLRHPFALVKSVRGAGRIIDAFKPDVIFSKGGVVSVPLCYVAHRKKIPIVLHESDAVMGRANRMIARWATVICTGFPMGRDVRFGRLYTVTGNPVRPDITQGSRSEGLSITGFSGKRPILLIWGGSQGAQAINEAVVENLDELLKKVDIVHLTGRGKKMPINDRRGVRSERPGYWQTEFASDELPHLFAIADIALSRAGAGAIAELAANGIPTILVPIIGLANNHQFLNAIGAQENGGCILLLQDHLTPGLTEVVGDLLNNPEQRTEISRKMHHLSKPDAAGQIAKILLQCVAQDGANH